MSAERPLHDAEARAFVASLALALRAAVLLQAGNPLAEGYCESRLGRRYGNALGTLAADAPVDAAVGRGFAP